MVAYCCENSTHALPAPLSIALACVEKGQPSGSWSMRKWTRPTVRKVTCGMEINMYFAAEL